MSIDPLRLSDPAILWIPDPIHADAVARAKALNFDVLLPHDRRLETANWTALADAVVLRQGYIHAKAIEESVKLKIISRSGTGTDTVRYLAFFHYTTDVLRRDVEACRRLNIAVSYLPGFNAKAVAEHVLALTLSLTRRVAETTARMKAGQRLKSVDYMAEGLEGKTVGLIGQGAIAREVALKFIGAFSCRILVYSPTSPATRWTAEDPLGSIQHTRCRTLRELLGKSHIVSLHCPVKPETVHLIDAEALGQMQESAYLVNAGRGSLVDEKALLEALKSKRMAGAALDCFEIEPATTEDYKELFELDQLVLTPHLGATTQEVVRGSTILAVENCARHLKGLPLDHRAA